MVLYTVKEFMEEGQHQPLSFAFAKNKSLMVVYRPFQWNCSFYIIDSKDSALCSGMHDNEPPS